MDLYKDINSMPITVFMQFQKYVIIEQGLGSNFQDFGQKLSKLTELVVHEQKEQSLEEIKNLYHLFYSLVDKKGDVKLHAIASLVKGNEGKSEEELGEFVKKNLLSKNVAEIYETYFDLKKKLLQQLH